LRLPIFWLYRQALRLSDKTWFQNPDDFAYFVRKKLIPREKGIVIRSGGINPEEYSPASVSPGELEALRQELGVPAGAHCVLMVAARMIWSKGVRQFVEAAIALHEPYPHWYFIMVCPDDPGPDRVPKDYLVANRRDRLMVIDTFRYDIIRFAALADIMVLPSFYREGVPRTLLEGLAMGKPIITTDHPGCREVVDEGRNGFLIPPRNSAALAEKLRQLMDTPRTAGNSADTPGGRPKTNSANLW
jgi:N,N'-diacetylbacillosaminyl-diphospho-undecaprenol alpha-1,3-N-acetylgalactosaminyltransferase